MSNNRFIYKTLRWVIAVTLTGFFVSCQSDVRNGTRIPPVVKKPKAQWEKDALLSLTVLINRDIDTDINYFKRARIYFEQERFQKALEDVNEAIDEQGNSGDYFLLRGKINREIGDIEKAQEDAERAEALQQNSPELYVLLADILQARGKFKDAEKYLAHAMQMAPYDGSAYYVKGMLEARQGDSLASITSFNDAINSNPRLLRAYLQNAVINRRLLRYDQALAINNNAIKRFPNVADLYFENGEIYNALAKPDTALIFYTKSVQLNPRNTVALYQVATIQIKQKNYYKALTALDQLDKLKSEYSEISINNLKGLCYEKLGNYTEARAHYNISVEIDKTNREARNGLWRIILRERGNSVEDYQ